MPLKHKAPPTNKLTVTKPRESQRTVTLPARAVDPRKMSASKPKGKGRK